MTGSSFQHAKRGSVSPIRALRIFEAAGGRCQCCTRKLGPQDDWNLDHGIALENGGSDDDHNRPFLCPWCHKEKTAGDHGRAAKAFVPQRFKQSRWGR